ncbi:MAG: polysaccharide biosynthesis/export family protein [Ignavibacteriales bacterium]
MQRKFVIILGLILLGIQSLSAQNLHPGDGVRIAFYNITDQISGDYFIQQNGTLQLPFIGTLKTENVDYENLRSEIVSKYDSLYKRPELIIRPLYRINILGEVKTPGSYYVTGVEKLSDLIAQAGGETGDANLDNIYIVRQDKEIKVDASQIIEQGNKRTDINLISGDRIYVPKKWWVGVRNTAIIVSGAAVLVTLVSLFIKK